MDFEALVISLCHSLACSYRKEEGDYVLDVTLEGRRQIVTASFFEESEEYYMRLSTAVDSREALREKRMVSVLELNYSLLYGCFALFGGDLVLTDVMPVRELQIEKAAAVVSYLARMGDNFEMFNDGGDAR